MKRACSFFALLLALASCETNSDALQHTAAGDSGVEASDVASSDSGICAFPDTTYSTGPTVISELADGLSSDRRGPYLEGMDGVIASGVGNEGKLTIYTGSEDSIGSLRSFTVNLSRPVPGGGGVSLEIATSGNRVGLIAQWNTTGTAVRNLNELAIGQTVTAAQMNVSFRVNGRKHVLQMGPQAYGHCVTRRNPVHGIGTSTGTIYRASRTKWVMDLPSGSVGRLFDVEEEWDHAVDKGLYYVHAHYEIGS